MEAGIEQTDREGNARRSDVPLAGAEVHHVIDLGPGGLDEADNLWPIKEPGNQAAGKAMYGQQVPPPCLPSDYPGRLRASKRCPTGPSSSSRP